MTDPETAQAEKKVIVVEIRLV